MPPRKIKTLTVPLRRRRFVLYRAQYPYNIRSQAIQRILLFMQ